MKLVTVYGVPDLQTVTPLCEGEGSLHLNCLVSLHCQLWPTTLHHAAAREWQLVDACSVELLLHANTSALAAITLLGRLRLAISFFLSLMLTSTVLHVGASAGRKIRE